MKTSRSAHGARLACVLAGLLVAQACADPSTGFAIGGLSYDSERFVQWKLPKPLREISGLAMDDQQRLFAHDDEHAVIHQLDYREGRLIKSFAIGSPPARADFEGIAVADGRFYLVTSDGDLYRAPEGGNGDSVGHELIRTGLGADCEIEGLAFHSDNDELLIACKTPRRSSVQGFITIYRWSLRDNALSGEGPIQLDLRSIEPYLESRSFHPSGIDVSPGNGHLLVVAARERALLELTLSGELREVIRLPETNNHRQTEGIALTAGGDLILADEGGKKRGRLGVYTAD